MSPQTLRSVRLTTSELELHVGEGRLLSLHLPLIVSLISSLSSPMSYYPLENIHVVAVNSEFCTPAMNKRFNRRLYLRCVLVMLFITSFLHASVKNYVSFP